MGLLSDLIYSGVNFVVQADHGHETCVQKREHDISPIHHGSREPCACVENMYPSQHFSHLSNTRKFTKFEPILLPDCPQLARMWH